jgi:DNA-binding CsgD family transcriptional regulator
LLDALAAGVLLTDSNGRVLYMNRAAERQVESGDVLCIVDNHLQPTDEEARVSLMAAIAGDRTGQMKSPSRMRSVALPGARTKGLVATVLPLTRRKSLTLISEAAAAVIVQGPVQKTHLPSQAFAKLYDLTGSELRVLLAISLAHGIKETAKHLGISETTTKTHLQHIYAKTGTTKLSELLSLFTHSVLRLELDQNFSNHGSDLKSNAKPLGRKRRETIKRSWG